MTDKLREQSIEFAKKHLFECAKEILEWGRTSILCDGKLRELAKTCEAWVSDKSYALGVAEAIVKDEALRAALAQQDAQAVRHKFLANGTRFKMSFFQNEDREGNTAPGTHVTCFEAFEDELDGRWVALVPAEDDCHLNAAPTPPARLAALAVPQGWKLVPVEPTPEMCNPSGDVGIVAEMAARYRREIWESMLNAAPTPPAQLPLTVEQYTEIAHRTASRYAHRSDHKQVCYTFFPHTLDDFVRRLEAAHNIGTKP